MPTEPSSSGVKDSTCLMYTIREVIHVGYSSTKNSDALCSEHREHITDEEVLGLEGQDWIIRHLSELTGTLVLSFISLST